MVMAYYISVIVGVMVMAYYISVIVGVSSRILYQRYRGGEF